IGVGVVVALLVDVTIVRGLLVPATMRLLGDRAWWAPGPLARWWRRHGLPEEGGSPLPAAGVAPEAAGAPQRAWPAPPAVPRRGPSGRGPVHADAACHPVPFR